jgi:nicotinamidase-related amidase
LAIALVLLDLQKGILSSSAITFENPDTPRATLRAAESLLNAARAAARPVVHVGVSRSHHRGAFDNPRSANALKSGRVPRDILALAPGSPEIEFELRPAATEDTIYKMGVSAFEGTRLDQVLRNAQVREVMVAGAFTHMVVESTVRQGFDLGYTMIVVSDACCAPVPGPHNNALAVGIPNFALVMDSAQAIERLKQGASVG